MGARFMRTLRVLQPSRVYVIMEALSVGPEPDLAHEQQRSYSARRLCNRVLFEASCPLGKILPGSIQSRPVRLARDMALTP